MAKQGTAYRWYCGWDVCCSYWEDSVSCSSHSRVLFSTREKAQKAGNAHARRTGHGTGRIHVVRVDRRRFRGWKVL